MYHIIGQHVARMVTAHMTRHAVKASTTAVSNNAASTLNTLAIGAIGGALGNLISDFIEHIIQSIRDAETEKSVQQAAPGNKPIEVDFRRNLRKIYTS